MSSMGGVRIFSGIAHYKTDLGWIVGWSVNFTVAATPLKLVELEFNSWKTPILLEP